MGTFGCDRLASLEGQSAGGRSVKLEGELVVGTAPVSRHLLQIVGSNQRQSVAFESELALEAVGLAILAGRPDKAAVVIQRQLNRLVAR